MVRAASLLAGVLVLSVNLALAACGADEAGPSTTAPPAPTDQPPVTPPPDAGTPVVDDGVVVSHNRQTRGAWISTVYNGTWPSATGLSAADAKAELLNIFDRLASARMNTVFLQVRSEADALYASSVEPWSRFLTGTQGQDPGWDPLAFAVEEGHRRGLEVHAWLNPYRAQVSKTSTVASTHITNTLPSAMRTYGNQVWMDPGVPEVRARILTIVADILTRYDVDGIHFDDYFYPYPVAGATFDDNVPYNAYKAGGGTLTKDDWRRNNVDTLIHETGDRIALLRANARYARFGVSPFGIYRPGTPEGITGLDAYATLYCDPVKWMNEGWVDYLAPQLYWPTTQAAQAFGKLVTWWASIAKPERPIFVGHDATKAGTASWSLDEYDAQMTLVAAERPHNALGSVFFSAKPLVDDQAGLRTALAAKHWTTAAAPPPLPIAFAEPGGAPPEVVFDGVRLLVSVPEGARTVAFYHKRDGAYVLEHLLQARVDPTSLKQEMTVAPGEWAVSTIDRRGVETRGAPVLVQ